MGVLDLCRCRRPLNILLLLLLAPATATVAGGSEARWFLLLLRRLLLVLHLVETITGGLGLVIVVGLSATGAGLLLFTSSTTPPWSRLHLLRARAPCLVCKQAANPLLLPPPPFIVSDLLLLCGDAATSKLSSNFTSVPHRVFPIAHRSGKKKERSQLVRPLFWLLGHLCVFV